MEEMRNHELTAEILVRLNVNVNCYFSKSDFTQPKFLLMNVL